VWLFCAERFWLVASGQQAQGLVNGQPDHAAESGCKHWVCASKQIHKTEQPVMGCACLMGWHSSQGVTFGKAVAVERFNMLT
jgi:hypothetical protein